MATLSPEELAYKLEIRKKTSMPLIWLGMGSIIMIFAALTSAVIVSKSSKTWVEVIVPQTFLYSTIAIVLSSGVYWWASRQAKKGAFDKLKWGTLVTFLLGLLFAYFQFQSWGEMTANGVFFAGPSSNVSGSYFYVLSGLHLAHLIGGLVSLMIVFFKASRGHYTSNNLLGLQVSTTYWHFLGVLWVYLYVFLNFIA